MIFTKVTKKDEIYYGVMCIIVSELDSVAMSTSHGIFSGHTPVLIDQGTINPGEEVQKFILTKGPIDETYAFKLANGPDEGKYLSYTGSANELHVTEDITHGASWLVDFELGDVVIESATAPAAPRRRIFYNNLYPRFAAYTSRRLRKVQLYVALDTRDPTKDIELRLKEYIPTIAYAVGYDITDEQARTFIETLVFAGAEDMIRSGVPEEAILNSRTVLSALIIFTNDNLNMSAGKYVTSPMYLANVDKLREQAGLKS